MRRSTIFTACLAVCWMAHAASAAADSSKFDGLARFEFKTRVATPGEYAAGVDVEWSEELRYEKADALSIHFSNFSLGEGDTLFVMNERGDEIQAFEGSGPHGKGEFWTPPIPGERLLLRFTGFGGRGGEGFKIDRYAAHFADLNTVAARRAQINSAYSQTRSPERPLANADRVIYGADNRMDAYQVTNPDHLEFIQGSPILIFTSELTNNGNGTYTLQTDVYDSAPVGFGSEPLCMEEPFRGQLTIGNCSAFLVGDDIVVTAGHCLDSGDCGSTAFLFGWEQASMATGPATTVPADNVYFCSQIIDQELGGGLDHCVARLDRPVVGRNPLPISRDGNPPVGTDLVMVGYPRTIPVKVDAGGEVKGDSGTFVMANVDAYGGNSGSMVARADTNEIIGILVRGNADFVSQGGCAISNMLPDATGNGGDFEEISTVGSFASFIPELSNSMGRLSLDSDFYNCAGSIMFDVRDSDLEGAGTTTVTVVSSGGDLETVTLAETGASSGRFQGSLATTAGSVANENGMLEVADGDAIAATYVDADDGEGGMNVDVTALAAIDCSAPTISNVMVTNVTGRQATITFDTSEEANGAVFFGTDCAGATLGGSSFATTSHTITLTGLAPLTEFFFRVEAADAASNVAADDNGGACYSFTTLEAPTEFFTELYTGAADAFDLSMGTLRFIPDSSANFYRGCREAATAFPTDPAGATALTFGTGTSDFFIEVPLTMGPVELYGQSYNSVFVGSNGYVTFGSGDTEFAETLADHFSLPRVAAVFDDHDPRVAGSRISVLEDASHVAITWENVPQFNTTTPTNNYQIELFRNGEIAITHLAMASLDGLVGLSAGQGVPEGFGESDLSAFGTCATSQGTIELDRAFYNCSSTLFIEVVDADLNGDGTVDVLVVSNNSDSETVSLTETPASSGVFTGSITATASAVTMENGNLDVADGVMIIAIYTDADDGMGGGDVEVEAEALVDCSAPIATTPMAVDITSNSARIVFDTDEDATSLVEFGEVCGSPTGMASGPVAQSHSVSLTGLTPNTTYFYHVVVTDLAGNSASAARSIPCFTFTTLDAPTEWFTEIFTGAADAHDLDNTTVRFRPNGTANFYSACAEPATAFPTDPAGGSTLTFTGSQDDGFATFAVAGGQVGVYGQLVSTIFIGTNGYVTFGEGSSDFSETTAEHFDLARVAALYDDLDVAQGGSLTAKETADRVAVTWQNVPEHGTSGGVGSNSMQIELFFNGEIAITYLAVSSLDSIVGLSDGNGTPAGFAETNFSALGSCISSEGTVEFDREAYACGGMAMVTVEDADLVGAGTAEATLTSTAGDTETLTLTETPANSGAFVGSIALDGFSAATAENGTLEVAAGGSISARYVDADDGSGSGALATDSATIDCAAPMISNVMVASVTGSSATITFDTDEPATGSVQFGDMCGSLGNGAMGGVATSHSVVLTGLTPNTTYHFAVGAEDPAGNSATDDNMGSCYMFTTLDVQTAWYTQLFTAASASDLDNTTITFTPDGSANFYAACVMPAFAFPTDPAGGTTPTFQPAPGPNPQPALDDGSAAIALSNGMASIYGQSFSTVFVGTNGFVTFSAGDTEFDETLADHFASARVSGYWDDMNADAFGTITVKETPDRLAVTWEGVPEWDSGAAGGVGSNNFQIELFFDGRIAITHLGMTAADGLVGLSAGGGTPTGFAQTDLSNLETCPPPDVDSSGVLTR